jgi:hypothetical protein
MLLRMKREHLHRLLRLSVLSLALLLFGWVVMLSIQEETTPWLVRGFLITLWLVIAYTGLKSVLQ